MALMAGELYTALKEANVSDEQARKAATEVANFDKGLTDLRADNAALRADMNTGFAKVYGDMNTGFAAIRGEMSGLRGEMALLKWMTGTVIVLASGIAVRLAFLG